MSDITDNSELPRLRENLYFSSDLDKAIEEVGKRSSNQTIDNLLAQYFGEYNIDQMYLPGGGPYAVLSRSIATPNFEQLLFIEYAKKHNLTPIILEYDGKFVTKNKEKLSLCNFSIFDNKNSCPNTYKIADTNFYQGKNIKDIKTYWGEELIDFHHNLFSKCIDKKSCTIFNFTEWFNETRTLGPNYYFFFLLLFMKNSILFENYILGDESELEFVLDKVVPSINDILGIFKLKPLIFPFLPLDGENDDKWLSYDIGLKSIIEKSLKQI